MKTELFKSLLSKINAAVFLSITISLLTVSLFLYVMLERIIRERIISDLRVHARIIGSNCSAALLFDDSKAARDILSSLSLLKEVESAVLFNKDGKEFTYYIKKGSIFKPYTTEQLNLEDTIVISEDIEVNGEKVGKIFLTSNTERLRSQRQLIIKGVIWGLLGSLFIALLLVYIFSRRIFHPVRLLLNTMKMVSEKEDYSIRAEVRSEDEFELIARGFNEMLSRIQERDAELKRYREHLEEEVRKRTEELEELNKRLEKELNEVKRMEEQVLKSATEWQTTFDAISDPVFLLDEKGVVRRCNRAAAEILNKGFAEIIGNNVCKIAHNDEGQECGIKEAIENRIRVSKVIHIKERVFQVYFDPILSQERLSGLVHIMSDITEKVALDENLRQIQKMEAIGRLAGGVAHDFNNLLSILTLYTGSLMKRLKEDQRSINELNEISKVIERATSLTRQLLTFSRRQIVNPEIFDANESLRVNAKMLQRLIGENIELVLRLQDSPAFIYADKSQFDNVIMNMVINSKDAMPDGGQITISTEVRKVTREEIHLEEVPDRRYLILRISDNGQGMSEEVQKRIFEPFFTTKPKGKGTGLGLSIVYGFVRQSNGFIDVKSREKVGTTFTIYLPISDRTETKEKASSGLIKIIEGSKLRIMLVEDDEDVRRSIVKMLKDHHFDVVELPNAREAIRMLSENKKRFDLIITDIVMPEINGVEFYKRVQSEINSEIPFIFITGYSDDYLPEKDIDELKDRIIQKPFSESQLINKIKEFTK